MSKAILVVDMPQSCSKCKFAYEFNGYNMCRLMIALKNGYEILPKSNFAIKRHDKCPLKEVPDKFEIYGIRYKGKNPVPSYRIGWNACIDEILKGCESDE